MDLLTHWFLCFSCIFLCFSYSCVRQTVGQLFGQLLGAQVYSILFYLIVKLTGLQFLGWNASSFAAPSVWNSLADYLCELNWFRRQLKMSCLLTIIVCNFWSQNFFQHFVIYSWRVSEGRMSMTKSGLACVVFSCLGLLSCVFFCFIWFCLLSWCLSCRRVSPTKTRLKSSLL